MIPDYDHFAPPFDFRVSCEDDNSGTPVAELRLYMIWFLGIIPQRIDQLVRVIRGTPGYESVDLSFTRDALGILDSWFALHVTTRPSTEAELAALEAGLHDPRDPLHGRELTDETLSLAVDVGMFFAQVLLAARSDARWTQVLRGKRNIEYGHPVIEGFGPIPKNPVELATVSAYKIAREKSEGVRLQRHFDYIVGKWPSRSCREGAD